MSLGRAARRSLSPGLAFAFAALLSSGTARAGSFAPDGTFEFDPTAVATFDFEDAGDPDAGMTNMADEHALAGKQVIAVVPQQGVDLPVKMPATRGTYRVSLWLRDGEVIGDVEISYENRVAEVVALFPTGRVTSDGWIEVANDHIRVDGPRLTGFTVGLFAPASNAVVDAIEVVPDGDENELPSPPNAKCSKAGDNACAADQVCVWSECRNVSGWVPPIPADRDDVADYLAGRMHLLFGPYQERTIDLPVSDVYLSQMRLAKDRWSYWNGFMAAVRRLHDGHTSTSGLADFVLRNPRPLAICFLEGDADLSHAAAPKDPEYLDVLVSHVGADHNLGLRAGDRLVRVDGMHPIAWARSLLGINWSQPSISNHVTFAELASSLRGMISRYAGSIEVIHCDPQANTCGGVEAISIADLPPDPPGTKASRVTCDNRPLRHVPGAPADHATGDTVYGGLVNEAQPAEKIYGLEWESLYTTNGSDGVAGDLNTAVNTWDGDARGVILDHRTGFGGTILAPEILWNFSIKYRASDLYVDRTFAEEEQPAVADAKARFEAALNTPRMLYIGSNAPRVDVPVALLLTEDVSASDWLALGMKGGQNTRLFAPFQTNGGFSTRYAFGYWLSLNVVLAVGDDIQPDGTTHNGRGVEPDVVVLPKQSDLLAGKDTVFEAALAWVRQEAAP
jgi:hypothetical protein